MLWAAGQGLPWLALVYVAVPMQGNGHDSSLMSFVFLVCCVRLNLLLGPAGECPGSICISPVWLGRCNDSSLSLSLSFLALDALFLEFYDKLPHPSK